MAGSGQFYTFSDSVTPKRSLADMVSIIDPQDTPCVSYFGTNNQGKFRIKDWPNHKYAWLRDTLKIRTATLAEAMDTTETGMDVSAGQGLRFKKGDVWQSDETKEYLLVTDISTDTVTVIRNWGAGQGGSQGTATSSITTATTLSYLFSARREGADSDRAYWTTPSEQYNFSQIFHHEIIVSGSEQDASTRYGVSDYYKYQLMKALGGAGGGKGTKGRAGDLMIDLENTFFHGQKVERTGATVEGGMGGVKEFVTSNVTDLNGERLTLANLNTAMQEAWQSGGKPNIVIMNAFNKQLINSWFASSVRTERSERTGGVLINSVETEFGVVDLMLNRWCPANEVYIMQKDLVGWLTLRDWFVQPLATNGDYRKDQIVGEFGFVVLDESAHAIIIDTATS
jgi:hypothetical protein